MAGLSESADRPPRQAVFAKAPFASLSLFNKFSRSFYAAAPTAQPQLVSVPSNRDHEVGPTPTLGDGGCAHDVPFLPPKAKGVDSQSSQHRLAQGFRCPPRESLHSTRCRPANSIPGLALQRFFPTASVSPAFFFRVPHFLALSFFFVGAAHLGSL